MKRIVDIGTELAEALTAFGTCDESREVIARAEAANGWFTQREICSAVDAVRCDMLDRGAMEAWLEGYPTLPHTTPRRVAIIMAGNIPLVGFFDLLCTLAAGDHAWVKFSSKDSVLMSYICDLIKRIEPGIPIYIYDEELSYDAIIATGGKEANRYFDTKFQGTKRLCRSSRHSIAVIDQATTAEDMGLLAEDIYSFSGLGCRNVAMIFAPKGLAIEIPTWDSTPKYRNNYLQHKAILTLRGAKYKDNGTSLFINSRELPTSLSTISVWEYESLSQVEEWIATHDTELQCIVSRCIDHPRCVGFGEAQHPTLTDYADGIDTMKFLE